MFQRTHTLAFSNHCNRPHQHNLIMSADGEEEVLQRKIYEHDGHLMEEMVAVPQGSQRL
jgi:hypothetical protein